MIKAAGVSTVRSLGFITHRGPLLRTRVRSAACILESPEELYKHGLHFLPPRFWVNYLGGAQAQSFSNGFIMVSIIPKAGFQFHHPRPQFSYHQIGMLLFICCGHFLGSLLSTGYCLSCLIGCQGAANPITCLSLVERTTGLKLGPWSVWSQCCVHD